MRVTLSILIALLFAVTGFGDVGSTRAGVLKDSPQAQVKILSAAMRGAPLKDGMVSSGEHGDIYAHYSSSESSFEGPEETIFGPYDPLYLHAYVVSEYPDTFNCIFYLFNITLREVLPLPCRPQSTDGAGNLLIYFPFRFGIFVTGDYILFAQVMTTEEGTTDWGFFPLARFSVVEPEE